MGARCRLALHGGPLYGIRVLAFASLCVDHNRGVPARMVKFLGAEHGLQRGDYQLYAAQEQIQWFREYLR
jgi:hypothetical protein